MCSAGTCVVRPVGAAMSVALAVDTPVAANLWKGSANNVVAKLTFYGGSTPVSITGLTLTSYGTTEATSTCSTAPNTCDIPAVKILDENNIQVGTDRTIAGNKVNFVFVPSVTVPANSSRTLSVAVNIGTGATTIAVVQPGIASATDITGATFSGTFPIYGNKFTIVPAGSIGSITIGQHGSLPRTSVKVGEKDFVLEKFTVSAGANEDVEINQITVKNDGTCSDSDITNIRIREVGGAVIAGPANLSAKKATINLAIPYSLTKGTAKNFEVIADVVSGYASPARTIAFYLDTGAVVGRGKLSGVNLTSAGTTNDDEVSIGKGALSISMSSAHPQGAAAMFIRTTTAKTIAAFSVRAIGEDVILNTIDVTFNATLDLTTTRYLSAVGLYVSDALVSDLKRVDGTSTYCGEGTDCSFSLNWTIPANTTKDLTVKAVTNTLGDESSYTLATTWSGYSGYGLSSGETVSNTDNVSSTSITIYGTGTAVLTQDYTKTPYNQGILAPSSGVVLGALKARADREDQKLTTLVITPSTNNIISSLTLFAEDGITQLSNPVSSTTTFTFDTDQFLTDIVFYKGVYKTILLKANLPAAADGTSSFYLKIADGDEQLETVGMDSGQPFDANAVIGAGDLDFNFISPFYGGQFDFNDAIVEIKKTTDSPSGAITRTSEAIVAKWTVTAITDDLLERTMTDITFTSKTGLPADATATALYKLYEEGAILVSAHKVADVDAGTIAFSSMTLEVPYGVTKEIYLTVDTRSTTIWPAGTEMHWTVYAYGDVQLDDGLVGFGGTVWSIPADANRVRL